MANARTVSSASGVVALVGRPNVGKSTLFNRLCRRRAALVHDQPGLTRDRNYGQARLGKGNVTVIDTGGLSDETSIDAKTSEQVWIAIEESDIVVFLVDGRDGVLPSDESIGQRLRSRDIAVQVVANKVDGVPELERLGVIGDAERLGLGACLEVSAESGEGIDELFDSLLTRLPDRPESGAPRGTPVAIVGRPNVGKSTLANTLVGDDRCVVYEEPGTTRDSVEIAVEHGGRQYSFFDTAGVRRKGRVSETVEKFSIVKTLDSLNRAHVALVLLDGLEGMVEQDLHILQYALEAGCGVAVVVNKLDQIDAERRRAVSDEIDRRLRFAPWIPVRFASAQTGKGVRALYREIDRIDHAGQFEVTTSQLNFILSSIVQAHPPPQVRGRTIKLRYMNKVGDYPPTVLIHGSQTSELPRQYVRHVENQLRQQLNLYGMPVVVLLRQTSNPFSNRTNQLTARQRRHRERIIRHRSSR